MPDSRYEVQISSSLLPALSRAQNTLALTRSLVEEASADYWYTQGMQAVAKQQYFEAAAAFRHCIDRDPKHLEALAGMAISLAWLKNAASSSEHLLQYVYLTLTKASDCNKVDDAHLQQMKQLFKLEIDTNNTSSTVGLGYFIILDWLEEDDLPTDFINGISVICSQDGRDWIHSMWYWCYCMLHNQCAIDEEEAIKHLEQAISISPELYAAHIQLIEMHLLTDYDKLIIEDKIKLIPILFPDLSHSYFYAGYTLEQCFKNSDNDIIIEYYQKAIDISPSSFCYHEHKGNYLIKLKRFNQVIEDYSSYISAYPLDSLMYYARAKLLFELEYFDAALQDCNACINLAQDSSYTYYLRHKTKLKLGIVDSEFSDLYQAIVLGGNYTYVDEYIKLADALMEKSGPGNEPEIRRYTVRLGWNQLIENRYQQEMPDYQPDPNAIDKDLANLTNYHREKYNCEKVINLINKMIELFPEKVYLFKKRALINFYLQDYELALLDFNKYMDIHHGDNVYDYLFSAKCHFMTRNYLQSIIDCSKAIDCSDFHPGYIYLKRAQAKAFAGDIEGSKSDLIESKCLHYDPKYQEYYHDRGSCMFRGTLD